MALIEKKQLEGCKTEFTIKVEGDEFKAGLDKAYKEMAPRLNVPGFRKGKAPKNLIIKTYGIGVFFDDAVKETYPTAYEAVITAEGFEPVDYPDVQVEDIDENGYTFKATVTGKPSVKLGKYKDLKAVKQSAVVADSEVDAEIEGLLDRNSRLVDVEARPVEDGDITIIDYLGKVDDVPFQGGAAEKQQLVIGSNQFIPGFEEQIKGHTPNADETFDITVKFPEEYHADELAGKDAVFTITLHAIKKNEKPALDDEFVKDISTEFETVADFKADMKKRLEARKEGSVMRAFEDALLSQIIDDMEVEIPEVMIERQIDLQVNNFDNQLKQQGMSLEMYIQMTGMQMEDFRKNFRDSAERNVKITLALEEIVKIEDISITDEEYEAELEKIAAQYGVEVDKIRDAVDRAALCSDIAMNKAIDMVTGSAEALEPSEEDEEKKIAKSDDDDDADDDDDEEDKD